MLGEGRGTTPWLSALAREPEHALDAEVRRQTSFIEWAEHNDPAEAAEGIDQLAADLRDGHRPQDRHADERDAIGDASVISWQA